MTTEKPTFCRICEPNCPLIASFDGDGSLTGLRPDMAHPSGGIACHKGLCYDRIHHDPDRLNWPQKRMNPKAQAQGDFQTVEWDDAMAEIGDRIRAVQDRHGPNSVAVYLGNPFAFNAAALLMAAQFQDLLGTAMRFSANTQDAANKFAAIGAVYGTAQAVMVPDIGNTSYLLCIGSNPKVSRWTTMSQPNDWDAVKAIKRRGGKILFINPRRTESSTADTGPTLLIRPGTDIYFLAAMLNEIASITDFKGATVDRYGKNLDGLRAFVSRYPADRVAAVTGIEADTIREVARDFLQAESAIAYSATGINQSRQGVLSVWLVEMLNFVTGNLGKKGGSYKPSGVADHFSPAGSRRQIVTSLGDFSLPDPIGFAVLPGALLPDLIACGDIRALFVLGGNPLLSAGGGMAARSAYAKLDLLVSVDIYRSATGEMSDFVLPSTDWLERPDINLISLGHQPFPMRNIATRWSRRWPGGATTGGYCRGWPRPSASTHHWTRTGTIMSGKATIDAVLGAGGLSIERLRQMPSHTALLPQAPHASVFERCLKHPDGKIDCMPAMFAAEGLIERCDRIFAELEAADDAQLRLISLRTPLLHNSWLNNSEVYRKGKHEENPLHMTGADAAARGFVAGDRVRIWTDFGEAQAQLLIDDDLCPGAVAMSHGYGQENSFALRVAQRNPGANCNGLMPVGQGSFEPLSYMSWLSGVPVEVERMPETEEAR